MLETKNLVIEKHVRLFFSKKPEKGDEIWVMLHGYAQSGEEFFEPFKNFIGENRVIIIPQAPSRFYQKGIRGNIGASWMTKEDRGLEIMDQIKYLDQVFDCLELKGKLINILGFSQGAPVAIRWATKSQKDIKLNKVVLWSGNMPEETIKDGSYQSLNIEHIHGDQDQFVPNETWELYFSNLKGVKRTKYTGGHFINESLINEFLFKKCP